MLDKNLVENILDNRWHISLTTFRKNGQGVSTPVWFVLKNGKLLNAARARLTAIEHSRFGDEHVSYRLGARRLTGIETS